MLPVFFLFSGFGAVIFNFVFPVLLANSSLHKFTHSRAFSCGRCAWLMHAPSISSISNALYCTVLRSWQVRRYHLNTLVSWLPSTGPCTFWAAVCSIWTLKAAHIHASTGTCIAWAHTQICNYLCINIYIVYHLQNLDWAETMCGSIGNSWAAMFVIDVLKCSSMIATDSCGRSCVVV